MYISSFYVSSTALSWSQRTHNLSAKLFNIPFICKQYDLIDVKTLKRERFSTQRSFKRLPEFIIKIALISTIVVPILCHFLSSPSANKMSWKHIEILFNRLSKQDKQVFIKSFLQEDKNSVDLNYSELHQFASNYRNCGLENDFLVYLLKLDPELLEVIKKDQTEFVHKKIFQATLYCLKKDRPYLKMLYAILSSQHQIDILKQANEKERSILIPLSIKSAFNTPGQFLFTIAGLELEKSLTSKELNKKFDKLRKATTKLEVFLPTESIIGVFWKIRESKKSFYFNFEEALKLFTSSEKTLIQQLEFNEIFYLKQFKQPWSKIWQTIGQENETFERTYYALSSQHLYLENSLEKNKKLNRDLELHNSNLKKQKILLKILPYQVLEKIIKSDPNCKKLKEDFGISYNEILGQTPEEIEFSTILGHNLIKVPKILMQWWSLYEKIDPEKRFDRLLELGVTDFSYLTYFEGKDEEYLLVKNCIDSFIPLIELAQKELNDNNYTKCCSFLTFEKEYEVYRRCEKISNYIDKLKEIIEEALNLTRRNRYRYDIHKMRRITHEALSVYASRLHHCFDKDRYNELEKFRRIIWPDNADEIVIDQNKKSYRRKILSPNIATAFTILELDSKKQYSIQEINHQFRLIALKAHPDKNGNKEKFQHLVDCRDRLREHFKNNK